jgi:hypothetical protein
VKEGRPFGGPIAGPGAYSDRATDRSGPLGPGDDLQVPAGHSPGLSVPHMTVCDRAHGAFSLHHHAAVSLGTVMSHSGRRICLLAQGLRPIETRPRRCQAGAGAGFALK